METPIPHEDQTQINDGEEEEEIAKIDFPESDIPEVDFLPEVKPEVESGVIPELNLHHGKGSDVLVKRDLGGSRFRDRFWYHQTATTTDPTRRSLSNSSDSESEDDRVDIVTPVPGR